MESHNRPSLRQSLRNFIPRRSSSNGLRSLFLKRFKLSWIKLGSIIQFVGSRGTGKSTMLDNFMYCTRDIFHDIHAVSYTEYMTGDLEGKLPPTRIHKKFSEAKFRKIIHDQQKHVREAKKNGTPFKHMAFIFDDSAFDDSIWKSETIKELFYNGRHSKITFIFCTQDAGDLPKKLRGQVDIVMAARELIKLNIETLHKNYFGAFDSYRDFRRVFKQMTQDFRMLIFAKNINRSNKIEDVIYWFKAKDYLPPYRMCHPEIWALSIAELQGQDPMEEEEQRRQDEELIRQKTQEAIRAKQPLHEIVACDSHGRPVSSKPRRRKRHLRRSAVHEVTSSLSRFDRMTQPPQINQLDVVRASAEIPYGPTGTMF